MNKQKSIINKCFEDIRNNLDIFISKEENINKIYEISDIITKATLKGNKVFTCGNGGSMCDAMHFAQELTGKFDKDRKSLPAIAISDPSYLTCTSNDYGYEHSFDRMIEGLGKNGDVLVAISTSGNSVNVVNAVDRANKTGLTTIGMLGKDGGKLKDMCGVSLIAPGDYSARVQEIHIQCLHIIIEIVENNIFFGYD